MTFRVLITGSRNWSDKEIVEAALTRWYMHYSDTWDGVADFTVVHGAAKGADTLAQRWALDMQTYGLPVEQESHPADWQQFGKRAGYLRNYEMVKAGADVCLAFPTLESRGTFQCMDLAKAAGIQVFNLGTATSRQ